MNVDWPLSIRWAARVDISSKIQFLNTRCPTLIIHWQKKIRLKRFLSFSFFFLFLFFSSWHYWSIVRYTSQLWNLNKIWLTSMWHNRSLVRSMLSKKSKFNQNDVRLFFPRLNKPLPRYVNQSKKRKTLKWHCFSTYQYTSSRWLLASVRSRVVLSTCNGSHDIVDICRVYK